MDKYEKHKKICESINDLYKEKNKSYGNAFAKTLKEIGLIHVCGILKHKICRFHELISGAKENDESMVDTLMDIANYSIITLIEIYKDKDPVTKKDNTLLDVQSMLNIKTKSEDCVCNFKMCPTCKQYSFFSHDGIVGYCVNSECEYLNRYGG